MTSNIGYLSYLILHIISNIVMPRWEGQENPLWFHRSLLGHKLVTNWPIVQLFHHKNWQKWWKTRCHLKKQWSQKRKHLLFCNHPKLLMKIWVFWQVGPGASFLCNLFFLPLLATGFSQSATPSFWAEENFFLVIFRLRIFPFPNMLNKFFAYNR